MSRKPSTTRSGSWFDEATINAVWRKATPVSGLLTIRKDSYGSLIQWHEYGNRDSAYGWEIDHIKPVAAGGLDDLDNLQPLQWENNLRKSDSYPNRGYKAGWLTR